MRICAILFRVFRLNIFPHLYPMEPSLLILQVALLWVFFLLGLSNVFLWISDGNHLLSLDFAERIPLIQAIATRLLFF